MPKPRRVIHEDHERYTVAQLRKWKAFAERLAQRQLEAPQPRLHDNVEEHPRIVWVSSKGSPLKNIHTGSYLCYAAQIWFQNEPTHGQPVARALTAYLAFFVNGQRLFPEIRGEWAIANAADNVGMLDTVETLETLPPNGEKAKLFVLHKRITDSSAYAWSRGAREYDGGKHPSQEIPVGTCDLHARIRGIGIDETFRFQIINPGAGAEPFINGPLPRQTISKR
jgi:hypothetical protein